MLLWAVPGGSRQGKSPSGIAKGGVGSKLSLEGLFSPSLPHPLPSLKVWNDSGRLLEADPQLLC